MLRRAQTRSAPATPHRARVVDVDGVLAPRLPDAGSVTQTWPVSTGLGSLDASRAGEHVLDPSTGRVLTGEVDALGDPFDAQTWAARVRGRAGMGRRHLGHPPWTGNSWG
jgi:serine protease AprX